MTLAKYQQIREGMTKAQVDAIVGNPGRLDSSTSGPGFTTERYSWGLDDGVGGNAFVLYQNGIVIGMGQFSLR